MIDTFNVKVLKAFVYVQSVQKASFDDESFIDISAMGCNIIYIANMSW